MRSTFRGLLVWVLVLSFNAISAQQKTINGTVTSEDGLPLPGVNIVVRGTTQGTQSDFDGRYTIRAEEYSIIMFSYLGFLTVEEQVGNRTVINIVMTEDATELQEVVVTALGISREKKSLGYATQEVQGEAITKVKTQNFLNTLSGRVAGLERLTAGRTVVSVRLQFTSWPVTNSLLGTTSSLRSQSMIRVARIRMRLTVP